MRMRLPLGAVTCCAIAIGCSHNRPAETQPEATVPDQAAAQTPDIARVDRVETLAATVTAVDVGQRLLSLRGDDDSVETIEVSPDVYNLAQVKAGDKVVVRYYALAAQLKSGDDAAPSDAIAVEQTTARAVPGARPAAGASNTVTTTVVIDSVDQASNEVVFRGPSGLLRSVNVVDPQVRKLAERLKKGDLVEVTYTEALAVSVEADRSVVQPR